MHHENSKITGFVLKIAAILGMTANHIAHIMGAILPNQVTLVLYCFGGLTFPTMAFLLVEGYTHTSNLRKYASRLAIFALVAQVPFTVSLGWGDLPIPTLNVLFTLLLSLGLLWAYDHIGSKPYSFLAFLFVLFVSYYCDWALSGPIMVFLFYTQRHRGAKGILLTMAFIYIYVLVPNSISLVEQIGTGMNSAANAIAQGIEARYSILYIAGIPIHFYSDLLQTVANMGYALIGFTLSTMLMCFYNGKRGRSMKWFFYAYYPLHLIVIWAIYKLLT